MGKNKSAWLIIAETNLHVGDESVNNYGVIDLSIQRNPLTGIPCIHSSSLKGAIKEYISEKWNKEIEYNKVDCKKVFGSEKGGKDEDTKKGEAIFFDAELLALPVQDTDGKYYFKLAYDSEGVIQPFSEKLKKMGVDVETDILSKICGAVGIKEDQKIDKKNKFNELCNNENLPIIARNCLKNGESDNLWYEQVLPAKSVLGTLIDTDDDNLVEAMNGKIIQIGANATIGYGYCNFVKL